VTWAFLDDRADENPKLLAVGAEASWYWACGLCYCRRNPKVPGFIPAQKALVLFPVRGPRRVIQLLIDAGLWHEVEGGYEVHDYAVVYGGSPDEVPGEPQALSQKRAEAGRLGGLRSVESRRSRLGSAQPKQPEANHEANHEASQSKPAEANPEASPKQTLPKQVLASHARTGRASCAPGSAGVAGALGSGSGSGSGISGKAAAEDLSGHGPEANPKQQQQQRLPCPADLELTGGQRATLETAMIPGWAMEALTTKFRAKHTADPTDVRSLVAWRKSLASAIAGDWNDPQRRPKPPERNAETTGSNAAEFERRRLEAYGELRTGNAAD
jgi:hypothetical protein